MRPQSPARGDESVQNIPTVNFRSGLPSKTAGSACAEAEASDVVALGRQASTAKSMQRRAIWVRLV